MPYQEHNKIILFDGVCNLCNAGVDFVVKRDRKKKFRYASLQSETGGQILKDHGLSSDFIENFIFYDDGKLHHKSTAAIRVALELGGFWKLASLFYLVPRGLRDLVYDFIAARRYRWFGKKETCRLPSEEEKALFLG